MSAKLFKEIKQRVKDHGPIQEVVELFLEELGIPEISKQIKTLLEKANNLEILLLGENDLQNIDNMPDLALTVLDLNSNKINDRALVRISKFKDLGKLVLSRNQIKTFEGLQPLFKLDKLIELDLSENPVSELPEYNQFKKVLWEKIPTLEYLDHKDKEGNHFSDSDGEDLEDGSEGSEQSEYQSEENEGQNHSSEKGQKK